MAVPAHLHFKPKMPKIVELLLYLSHKRQHVDHYKACKLIYLADLRHLNRHGRPIVFDLPKAMQFGPVATKSYDLLKRKSSAFKEAGIDDLPFETQQLDRTIFIGAPKRPFNRDLFSKSDLTVFDEVLQEFGDYSFDQLHDVTSKHFAYRNAWSKRASDNGSVLMSYDDMIEESASKSEYIDDTAPVSHKM